MHISSLNIKNFRGIKSLSVEDLKMVNVFLGKNNVGKTTILEAIFLTLAPGNPQMAIVLDNLRALFHTNAEDFTFFFYQLKYENTIEIRTKYRYDDLEKELNITPIKQNSILISAQQIEKRGNNTDLSTSSNNIDSAIVNGLSLSYSYKQKHSKKQIHIAKIELINNGFKQTPAVNAEFFKATYLNSNNLMNALGERFDRILVNKEEGEIIRILKSVDNSIEGLTIGANNLVYVDTGFGKRFPINLLGDGAIKLISILISIYDTKNGILLIDEFSNGLHYTALECLWEAIFETAARYNVQLFLTTHDYESLSHLKNVLEIKENLKFQSEIRSYTIRKLPDGTFKSYLYDFPSLETAINEENEIR